MTKEKFLAAISAHEFTDVDPDPHPSSSSQVSEKCEAEEYDEALLSEIEDKFAKLGVASVDFDRGMPIPEFIERHEQILERHKQSQESGSVWPCLKR